MNSAFDLTSGIARSKAAAKVRGPFRVKCHSCGEYVREKELADHRRTCVPPAQKNVKPLTQPAALKRYVGLAKPLAQKIDPSLPCFDPKDSSAVKIGRKVQRSLNEIILAAQKAMANESDPWKRRGAAINAAKDELKKLSRAIRRGVEFELESKQWRQIL